MALARHQFTVTDELGNIIPGAHVEVRREDPGQPLAALKSDREGVSGMSNPFDADSEGFAAFHVLGGAHRIRVYTGTSGSPTYERIWRYVPIGTTAEFDIDVLLAGQRSKVAAATTANITIATALNNGDTLDGVTLATDDLVLVKDQTDKSENGIYVVGVSPARADAFSTFASFLGAVIAVAAGTANEGTLWFCTVPSTGEIDDADIEFTKITALAGAAATIAIGDVDTVGPSDPATVENTGTPLDAVLKIEIPRGAQGVPGPTTIAIGSVTTVEPDQPATVTNSGDPENVILDFQIPKGEAGDIENVAASDIENDSGVSGETVQDALNTLNGALASVAANVGKRGTVRAATTANITIATALNAGDSIDGVTLADDDLVLVKNQTASEENGVFVVGATPARDANFDTYNEHASALLAVQEGTTNADTLWLCTSNKGGTLNTTAISFTKLNIAGTLLAANALSEIAGLGLQATARGNIGAAAAGANSDIISVDALQSVNGGQLAGLRNLLINADGRFNQRSPSTNADNTYGHDRWLALTQTSTIAVSTVSDAENGTPRMWRLSQPQATAQRMGFAQWIEGVNCRHLRGKTVTLSGRIKFSLNAAVRYAICEWTGTEDTPSTARDIVNDWTDGAFTAGHFFKSTTFNVLATGSITPAAATLADLTKLSATVGNSANNLIVFIWTEGTAAQNATLDASLQLEQGSVATAREFRPFSIEYLLCQRYYFKTFNLNTTPAQNIGLDGGEMAWGSMTGASANGLYHFRFPAPMRSVTPAGILYNPAAANAFVRNATDSTDCGASSMNSYQAGATIFYTTPANTAVGEQLRVHATWDAEI